MTPLGKGVFQNEIDLGVAHRYICKLFGIIECVNSLSYLSDSIEMIPAVC